MISFNGAVVYFKRNFMAHSRELPEDEVVVVVVVVFVFLALRHILGHFGHSLLT